MNPEAHQLALTKRLVDEADRQLEREDDFGYGLAVSLAQDAVELLIRIIVRERSIAVAGKATWEEMFQAVNRAGDGQPTLPHQARISDLNKARVAFKHTGTSPSSADARRLVRYGVEFVEAVLPAFFGTKLKDLSMAQQVKDQKTRELLILAEQLAAAGNFNQAVIEATDAVHECERRLSAAVPEARQDPFAEGHDRWLLNYLNGLRLLSLGALVRFDALELVRFRMMAPRVNKSVNGKRFVADNLGGRARTEEEAQFAIGVATRLALAIQQKLG